MHPHYNNKEDEDMDRVLYKYKNKFIHTNDQALSYLKDFPDQLVVSKKELKELRLPKINGRYWIFGTPFKHRRRNVYTWINPLKEKAKR